MRRDWRLMPCETCQGEGRLYERCGWHSREFDFQWQEGEVDTGPCLDCDGSGMAMIEVFPIEMEDLPND